MHWWPWTPYLGASGEGGVDRSPRPLEGKPTTQEWDGDHPLQKGSRDWKGVGCTCLFPLAVASLPSRRQGLATIQLAKGAAGSARWGWAGDMHEPEQHELRVAPALGPLLPGSTFPRVRQLC